MAILSALPLPAGAASACSALTHQQLLGPGLGPDAAASTPVPPPDAPAIRPAVAFPAAAAAAAKATSPADLSCFNRQRTPRRRAAAGVTSLAAADVVAVDSADALPGVGANRQQCRASSADSSRLAGTRVRHEPICLTVYVRGWRRPRCSLTCWGLLHRSGLYRRQRRALDDQAWPRGGLG